MKMKTRVTCNIVGIGEVTLILDNGNKLVLNEVRDVSDMRLNIFSACKLNDVGMINQFEDDIWKICKGSMIVPRERKPRFLV